MFYGDVDVISREVRYQGFFRMDKFRLRHALFEGGMSDPMSRELFQRGHAVVMLPYDPVRDEVVFIEQFRIGAIDDPDGPWLVEFVAGMIGEGEQPEEVARRESLEESGCQVLDLIPMLRCYTTPGGCSETVELFCGRVDASMAGGIHGLDDEGEDIRVITASFDEAMAWLDSGRINSAGPIMAIQWLALNRDRIRARWSEV